jgi:hypothetical protein
MRAAELEGVEGDEGTKMDEKPDLARCGIPLVPVNSRDLGTGCPRSRAGQLNLPPLWNAQSIMHTYGKLPTVNSVVTVMGLYVP